MGSLRGMVHVSHGGVHHVLHDGGLVDAVCFGSVLGFIPEEIAPSADGAFLMEAWWNSFLSGTGVSIVMRIAIYNQMFGLDGRSFFKNVIGHYCVHYQKDCGKVLSRLDLNESLNLIGKSNADIVGLCEIYEGTENMIEKGLKNLGYKYVYFGKGHKFKYSDRRVLELIASKVKCKKVEMKNWPLKDTMGGGGGFVVCKFKGFTIFHVHLALPTKGYFKEQINYLQKIIKKTKGKVILMGDFNLPYKKLEKYFPGFNIATEGLKTCSITPIMKWFFWKDCDHVFVRGFKSSKADCINGRSDHKLVYADLENGKN